MRRTSLFLTIALFFIWTMPTNAQKVGVETTTPDSTFSIKNKVEIGGGEGDILFTDDLGTIKFPSTTLPNAPMIQMFTSGFSNADRMVLSHSPALPNMGIWYEDDTDRLRFGTVGSSSTVSIGVTSGHMAVGEIEVFAPSTFIVATSNDIHAGHFINTNASGLQSNGVYASVSGNGPAIKRAGFFEALQGFSRTYGVFATAAIADTNIAIYGNVGLLDIAPGDINRAAWFDDGDVVVDDHMLIGSSSLGDVPHNSALLELNSTSKGLLLPRMTSTQRTSISSPAEGLLVYDTDSSGVFVRKSANWASLSGGTTTGIWMANGSPVGPYVTDQVGIGDTPQFLKRLYIDSGPNMSYGVDLQNDYTGGLTKFGIRVEASSAGTGTRYGIYSKTWANLDGDPAYGIYAEGNQGTTDATVYGIYATAPGTGTGDRWAGYFDGHTRVNDQLVVGSETAGMPEPSAILDLQATDKGLLLPRMTSTQRTSISSPAEGLLVYDTTNDDVYVRQSGSWQGLAGGGSGGGLWTDNGLGIHYDGANVVIGDNSATFFERFYVLSDDKQYSGRFQNNYTGSLSKYGILSTVNFEGTGTRTAVYGVANPPSTGSADVYAVRGEISGNSPSDQFAIHGKTIGSGTGNEWAGYFEGHVGVENGRLTVGITDQSNFPVDDNYILVVDGYAIMEAIRVEMSADWPDYVFQPEYQLTPLEDLEQQIAERGHLPGIPSAQEVSEEGIDLGEMQAKTMEKIEELTLYLIEQQKEINSLKEEVKYLRNKEVQKQ